MTESTITAVIITHNEEEHIARCIKSVIPITKDVIIIDSQSSDGTVAIATELGAKVVDSEWLGYAETKNKGHKLAIGSYILSLDADEELSENMRNAIKAELLAGLEGVYSFNRSNNYCGQWMKHGGLYPDSKIRLFPKECTWEGRVHEKLNIKSFEVKHLAGDILHYSIRDKEDHISRERKYANLAKPYANKGMAFIASLTRFIVAYIIKRGFIDGKLGFQYALISAKSKFWRNS